MSEIQVKFLPRFLYLSFWRQKEQGLMYQLFVQETVSKEKTFAKEVLRDKKVEIWETLLPEEVLNSSWKDQLENTSY